jgi:putative SOS response-associated peptidase YedK
MDFPAALLQEHFGLENVPEIPARYNIAPSQEAACVLEHPGKGRILSMLRFGLAPHWAEDQKIGDKMINARAETVDEKPAFRSAFAKRRCLVPASGFYEWQKVEGGPNRPFFFSHARGEPLGLAGVWERWSPPDGGDHLFSFAIITVPANSLVAETHERMPAIIRPGDYGLWLNREAEPSAAKALLTPYPPEELAARPVSTRVNSPKNDDPSLIEAAAGE